MKIRFRFGKAVHGCLRIRISSLGDGFDQSLAYTPFEWLVGLIKAVELLGHARDPVGFTVTAAINPATFDFTFSWSGPAENRLTLEIYYFSDHRRGERKGKLEFSCDGTRAQLLLPLWRGLCDLESRVNDEEFAKHWYAGFPHQQLTALKQVVAELKREPA